MGDSLVATLLDISQNGGGVQQMLVAAHGELQNPITVCDTNFSILYHYPEHENALDFERQRDKLFMKTESIQNMHREKIVEQLYGDTKPFTRYRRELGIDILYCGIRIQRAVVGYVCVLGRGGPFAQADFDAAALLAQLLSIEMQKSSFFTQRAGLKYEYFLVDLIEGNIEKPELIRQRFAQLKRELCDTFQVICIGTRQGEPLGTAQNYLLEQALAALPGSMAFFYRGQLVALLSQPGPQPLGGAGAARLCALAEKNGLLAAASHPYGDILQTPAYYRQAARLLQYGVAKPPAGPLLLQQAFVLESALLPAYTPDELAAMVHPDIYRVLQHDRQHNTEYYATLATWLANARNAVKSAEELHIHKSTFFYRLNKIAELLEADLNDGDRLFCYEVSLRILGK